MQKVTREALIGKAAELLCEGRVNRVMGWQKGEFDYDITPAVFRSVEELEKSFVFNGFCAANFSKYLVKETIGDAEKVLVFLKPCDTYSFNQLLTEHRFNRDKVYVVGIACDGMIDINKIKNGVEAISSLEFDGDKVAADTLYDGRITFDRSEVLLERCKNCKSKKHVVFDEILGDEGEMDETCGRFDQVSEIEAMTPEERFAFWQGELSRCIRCNACRDVCPACTCEKCVFDNPASGVENKAAADSFEEKMFHIIRAFHVAGRCTDCGECSRVCPQHIPLHLLNRKFIKDIDNFYGEYRAGEVEGSRAPLVNYNKNDIEPAFAVERSGNNA